ncbi:hypothetical protein CVT24_007420 [Panaeolus cyanescens]|uniref:pyranose dehydrogenase (acceptor) n=1 Tax=Panaeolus cyanescens TaxID=181874 RepID=A0A409YKU0_9AGAR|nr:hypothetical protein CVT24_007420 [Panaeolus cyanescens]
MVSLLHLVVLALSSSVVFASPRLQKRASGVTTNPALANGQTFDYIVVGAGLAGTTVAARLAENPSVTVLLIEAGADNRNDPRVYDIYRYGEAFGSELTWSWPTDQGRGMMGGKTLGGSTSINGAAYTRGLNAQYDAWQQLLEPSEASMGWNWQGLWSYMKKSETFSPPNSEQASKGAQSINSYHGFSGPVQVTFPNQMYGGPQQTAFVNTLVGLTGINHYKDLNGGTPNCVSITPLSINWHDGDHRSSSVMAYLTPVETVTKINWKTGGIPLTASGVEFAPASGGSTRYTVNARREVILGAGAVQTPVLLQLSGIGDSAVLNPLGITTRIDLKTVGKNLQEQTMSQMGARGNGFNLGGRGPSNAIAFPNIYQVFGSGATTVVNKIRSSLASWASAQAGNALNAAALQTMYQIQADLIINNNAPVAEIFSSTGFPDTLGLLIWNLLPFSRGSIKIKNTDPFQKPTINVNFFAVDVDMDVQINAARLGRKILSTGPMGSLSAGETSPAGQVPDNAQRGSDAAWKTWIQNNFNTVSHPIGTASMMRRSLGGVVNAQLKVYDTTNLPIEQFFNEYHYLDFRYVAADSASMNLLRLQKRISAILDDPIEFEDRQQIQYEVKERYNRALIDQFNAVYGMKDSLKGWQDLCRRVGYPKPPQSMDDCKKIMETMHVNLVDLTEAIGDSSSVFVFPDVETLSECHLEDRCSQGYCPAPDSTAMAKPLQLKLLPAVLILSLIIRALCAVTSSATNVNGKTYDYIVVGGGLSGTTVAARLAENSAVTVLMVEVGGDDRKDPRVYDIYRYGEALGSELTWNWPTDQGRGILGGKTLGGGTSINGAAYTRGLNAQYDAWTTFLEPSESGMGWNWQGLWNYMKKSETFSPPNSEQASKGAQSINSYHGFSGPVQSINWRDADHRSSSIMAYLTPVENVRTKWTTLTKHFVTKITFKPGGVPITASGIEFAPASGGGTRYTAFARREVIVAAGAIQTPALLQLSGIGDSAILGPLGIQTKADVKGVGRNLQEQTMSMLGAKATPFSPNGRGPSNVIAFPNLYQIFGSNSTAVVNRMRSSIGAWADVASKNGGGVSKAAMEVLLGAQSTLIADRNAPVVEMFWNMGYPDTLGVLMWNLLPFSRGSVRITSTDPFAKPKISVNYFSADLDLDVQVAGSRLTRRLLSSGSMKPLSAGETFPGISKVADNAQRGTDAAWKSWIKNEFVAVAHPVGTASMMRRSLGGVVNAQLKVYDTTNVRVVDASMMPMQISAHLSATLYGVAEKAADLIKASWP